MSFYENDGQVLQTGILPLQELVERPIGNAATYAPIGGPSFSVPGIKKSRRGALEDISEVVGRIDSAHRFKIQRRHHSIADFPADPNGPTYGKLTVAGQTFAVIGVAYEGTAHVTLFLSDPET